MCKFPSKQFKPKLITFNKISFQKFPFSFSSAHCPQAGPQEEEDQGLPPPWDHVPPLYGQYPDLLRVRAPQHLLQHAARLHHRAPGISFPRPACCSPASSPRCPFQRRPHGFSDGLGALGLSSGPAPHSTPPMAGDFAANTSHLISICSFIAVCVLANSFIIFLHSFQTKKVLHLIWRHPQLPLSRGCSVSVNLP